MPLGMTADIYGHVDPDRHASVVEAFDRVLEDATLRHRGPMSPRKVPILQGVCKNHRVGATRRGDLGPPRAAGGRSLQGGVSTIFRRVSP